MPEVATLDSHVILSANHTSLPIASTDHVAKHEGKGKVVPVLD
jgi:hypothetical protein